MRRNEERPSAPDYTTACVVMFGINLMWVFLVIWAVWGLLFVAAVGYAIHRVIDRIAAARLAAGLRCAPVKAQE